VTVTSEVTVTLTPAATETPISPTFTLTPSTETLTLGGVTMEIGPDGVADMDSMKATGASDEIKAQNLAKVDPTEWGYKPGEVEIRNIDGKTFYTPAGEPDIHIAEWVGPFGAGEWEWDGAMMEHIPLFDGFAKTYPTTEEGKVRQTTEVQADAADILKFAAENKAIIGLTDTIYVYKDANKEEAIVARYGGSVKLDPMEMLKTKEGKLVTGWVVFKTTSGKVVKMKFKDIEVFIRGFN
jgi:hypothetical protein